VRTAENTAVIARMEHDGQNNEKNNNFSLINIMLHRCRMITVATPDARINTKKRFRFYLYKTTLTHSKRTFIIGYSPCTNFTAPIGVESSFCDTLSIHFMTHRRLAIA